MLTLQKDEKEQVLAAYNKANTDGKKLLESLFENLFSSGIQTFEDACQLLSVSENEKILLDYTGQNKRLIAAQAFLKLSIITEALNEGWTPDWTNDGEYKYYPWFNMQNGFSLFVVSCRSTSSRVSSRLCFKTRELVEYAAKQFLDIYKDYFTNN